MGINLLHLLFYPQVYYLCWLISPYLRRRLKTWSVQCPGWTLNSFMRYWSSLGWVWEVNRFGKPITCFANGKKAKLFTSIYRSGMFIPNNSLCSTSAKHFPTEPCSVCPSEVFLHCEVRLCVLTWVSAQVSGQGVPPATGVVAQVTLEGFLSRMEFNVSQQVSFLSERSAALTALERTLTWGRHTHTQTLLHRGLRTGNHTRYTQLLCIYCYRYNYNTSVMKCNTALIKVYRSQIWFTIFIIMTTLNKVTETSVIDYIWSKIC